MLIFLGIVLILIGFGILIQSRPDKSRQIERGEGEEGKVKGKEVQGGAVVMIGPIPIVVCSDPKAALMIMMVVLSSC